MRLIEILYQDGSYYVFNKPPGLVVIPTPHEEKTLTDVVNQQCPSKDNEGFLYPCHRLDRDTSGVIIFARGKKNQQLLMEEFHQRSIEKHYLALVQGRLKKCSGSIKGAVKSFDRQKFNKFSKAKWAQTDYRVLEQRSGYSLTEVLTETGRTNQIRIHFSEMGHPLVGERKYAFAKDFSLKFRRTALHAALIVWRHPLTKKMIEVTAPLPEDMRLFMETHT
ncbi:MAG: RluA family pseudouridine synthase [Candidatus Omnitrophica bacterium]|nr:RluA family pseudouridine synthase [Candidatus Omnitrophota bacterium]